MSLAGIARIDCLSKDNYDTWKLQMRALLKMRPRRPRKEYQVPKGDKKEVNTDNIQYAFVAEMPISNAMNGPDADEWRGAIADEIASILKKETWTLVDTPTGKDIIGSRMVLRNKYNTDGTIQRRKARLVAQGFAQRPGVHFTETFAPVARLSSERLLLSLAAQFDLKIHQLDVSNAYLNGYIEEEIFMKVPEMLEETLEMIKNNKSYSSEVRAKSREQLKQLKAGDKVCQIKRSLYGLKQAGRQWNKELDKQLRILGLKATESDPCVYLSQQGGAPFILIVHVDDILIASNNMEHIKNFKSKLAQAFEISSTFAFFISLPNTCEYKVLSHTCIGPRGVRYFFYVLFSVHI